MLRTVDDALPLILFAIPALDAGGPDRVIHALLSGLPRDSYSYAIVVQQGGGRYFDALPSDVARHILNAPGRYPWRAFARLMDDLRPTLVFTTQRMNLIAPLARLVQRHKPPIIARQANAVAADFARLKSSTLVKHRLAEHIVRWGLRRADAVVAQSLDMAAELAGELRPGQWLETIGNPVDVAAIVEQAQSQRADGAPQPTGNPSVVSVGRLMPQKGYDRLLAAWPIVRAAFPSAELTIFGEGPDRVALAAAAIANGTAGSIHLSGRSDTVLGTLAQASLFVSSSRYEGFSNALLEAMALGIAVVATDCPGATREKVIDGQTGTLVPTDAGTASPDVLATAIIQALADDRRHLGQAGQAHVAAQFGAPAVIDRYYQLLTAMIRAEGRNQR